jgi:capsular polysaccharide export protein
VPAFCFEEGYIRPGFITLEEGGNNDMSPLRTNSEFLSTPADTTDLPRPATGRAFSPMCWHGMVYFTLLSLGRPFFGANRHHRHRALLPEAFLWTRNALRKQLHRSKNFATIESMLEHEDGRYFLVALQVHDDLQLSCSGRGWTNERLITESIASFARSAEPNTTLVFKVHPLSRGHTSYRAFVRRQAELFGCSDRVRVIDDGSVGLLTRHARGVITVNSTSGLSALFHKKPLLVLGDALFRHPDLATCAESVEDIDRFWRSPQAPDPEKARNLLDHIRRQALVPGSFYLPRLWKLTCEGVIARLEVSGVRARARRRALKVVEPKPVGIFSLPEPGGNVVMLPLPAVTMTASIPAPVMPAVQSRTA